MSERYVEGGCVMPRKLTQEEFISRVHEVWGDRWDLSGVVYQGSGVRVLVRCEQHGEFSAVPSEMLRGAGGCRECSSLTLSLGQVLKRFSNTWGDRWDYTEVVYVNNSTPVTIICREHGEFQQAPASHWGGYLGCAGCRHPNEVLPKKVTVKRPPFDFFVKARKVWGDRWDYSDTVFTTTSEYIRVRCREHGYFTQIANMHLRGSVGCKSCQTPGGQLSTEEFVEKSKEVWGSRWDYSKTTYSGRKNDVVLTCKEHGDFTANADRHLDGAVYCEGCQQKLAEQRRLTTEEFIEKCRMNYPVWDYSGLEYQGMHRDVTLRCANHGEAVTGKASDFAQGKRACPKCKCGGTSKAENEVFEFARFNAPLKR